MTIIGAHYTDPEHQYPDQEIIDQLRPDLETFLYVTANREHLHRCLKEFKSDSDKGKNPSIEAYKKKISNAPVPKPEPMYYDDSDEDDVEREPDVDLELL